MKEIFEYQDYKTYLREVIAAKPKAGRGVRLALATSIGCPVSHISQVINGISHFSMEQAEATNIFLGHTEEEANFFLLLLQYSRAGTPLLRKRLETQIQQVITKRLVLRDRLGVKSGISLEDQSTFYSSWLYGAAHVIVTIEKYRTREAISEYLGIPLHRTTEILEFLNSIGLIIKKPNGRYEIGLARIHLGNDSPNIAKFHSNWRMKAIQSLDNAKPDDLHYSSAITISEKDVTKIKSLLVKYIAEIKVIIKDSKEEGIHCFALDFFRI